jgi:hypothetical protein
MAAAAARLDHAWAIAKQETRVLLVDLDTMPRQLVQRELGTERGITLVEARNGMPLAAAVEEADADVVLIGRDDPAVAAHVLGERPLLKLLAIVGDARELLLYELRPNREELGELSKDLLLRALRNARRPRSSWMP